MTDTQGVGMNRLPNASLRLCQRPTVVSYEPKKVDAKKGKKTKKVAAVPVFETLDSSMTEVKTCTNVARWIDPATGIHYCDRCKTIASTSATEEYGEYTADPGAGPCLSGS